MLESNLIAVRNALSVMFNPGSPPQSAKEASDWLQGFRSNNEQRRRRIRRDVPEACCWPVMIKLLTVPDASESERLFAAQALLYRVRRYELGDALDVEDPVALSQPPSSSAKPSEDATQRANQEGIETLSNLCVAASGGGVSKPVLNHLCLAFVTVALRVATWCPADQEETFICVDLVYLVSSAINKAAQVYATSHPGESIQATVANALVSTLAVLPECAAVNQMSIRPRALACALNDLRSDRAGEGLLKTLSDLEALTTGETRLRCCLQWIIHVGLRTSALLPLLPATASAITIVADQVSAQMTQQGCSATDLLQGGSLLTEDGYAACELVNSIFEAAVDREEALSEVNSTRVTVSGRRKARRQRANNASDAEQQMLEVELAKDAALVARSAAQLALNYFITPLHTALSLAMVDGDDKSKHMLINAAASCASSELPRLLDQVAISNGTDNESLELMLALLELLVLATNIPPGKGEENKTISHSLEPWLRFHDAAMELNINPNHHQSDWWIKAEDCMFESIISVMNETRLDHWDGGIGVCDSDDRELFDDWRKEARDWLRGMTSSKINNHFAIMINHSLIRRCLYKIINDVESYTMNPMNNDWCSCETVLHASSAFGRSITAATEEQAYELDPMVVKLLTLFSVTVTINDPSSPPPPPPSSPPSSPSLLPTNTHTFERLACACHPAVASAATLTVGALTNWMEKRCVSTRMQGAEAALNACRMICETSLEFSDRHPIYPIRSHDELHSGATALLKIAGSGPCCLSVAHQQGWLSRLTVCYHRIQSFRWQKLFPNQEYPLNINTNQTSNHHLKVMNDESDIPLSASSRRVLLACLFVLASAPGVEGVTGEIKTGDGNIQAASNDLNPLLEGIFHSLVSACRASGLPPLPDDATTMTQPPNVENDAMCLAQHGEGAIRSGLAVIVDTLADLEVSVFLSSGQKPCAQVISAAVSSLLASPTGLLALHCCFRLASASSWLCDHQGNNQSVVGGNQDQNQNHQTANGDTDRLDWGGRATHHGANIMVTCDTGIAELSGLIRWILSRALARCFSERLLDNQLPPFPFIPPTELLEFCLYIHRYDVWCDGSALFPVITTCGGGFNSDNEASSFSANGLNKDPISPQSQSGSQQSMNDYDLKKWEICNLALTNAIESTVQGHQNVIYNNNIPLAMNGPLLRKGNSYEALFTLANTCINRFKHLKSSMDQNQSNSFLLESSSWLQLLPFLITLIFESNQNINNEINHLSEEASGRVALGRSGGVSQKPRGAKQSQCLTLVFPGREAECAIKFFTNAIDCCPIHVVNMCSDGGGGILLCIFLLRCACGATPSWTLDSITLGFKNLAKASFEIADINTRNQAIMNASSIISTCSQKFNKEGNQNQHQNQNQNQNNEIVKTWAASGQLLCLWLNDAINDPRFPRYDVSNDAKTQFLSAVAIHCGKQDWSGLKNAIKQLCGGKRKTGAGKSLGRPPDYSPWENNFDSRSITAY